MFSIVPKKKVTIADIKQYLVDEFENTNKQQKEIDELKDKLKKAVETELKYETTLVTLDEYKNRLEEREKRIIKLEKDIQYYENKLRKENELKNNEIIKNKKINNLYDELNKSFNKKIDEKVNSQKQGIIKQEYLRYKNIQEKIIEIIQNLKGNVSKSKIIEIINKEFSKRGD